MAPWNPFRRRTRVSTGDTPVGSWDLEDQELEFSEGGQMPMQGELATLRWVAVNEAVTLARQDHDPELWDEGRMVFELERSVAHGHEKLRDQLANYVGARVRDASTELYEPATDIAMARDRLARLDGELGEAEAMWTSKWREMEDDEIELKRYFARRSIWSRLFKILVAAVFVGSEFIISAQVFREVLPNMRAGLEWFLAFGVTLALIVVPHYTAVGLKAGLTQHHAFDKQDLERRGASVPPTVARAVHYEEREDHVFKIGALIVGALLVAMVIPLSILRTSAETDERQGFPWWAFLFLLLLQYALSGYFFLREWLSYGPLSEGLIQIEHERDRLRRKRDAEFDELQQAVMVFHGDAEELVFTIQQAPRWDSYIVESYLETIHMCRRIVTIEQPDLAPFLAWAKVPYLGSVEHAANSPYPLDPLAAEHEELDDDGPLGRLWWMRKSNARLAGLDPHGDGERPPLTLRPVGATPLAGWLAFKNPDDLLVEVLDRYGGLPLHYRRADLGEGVMERLVGDTAVDGGRGGGGATAAGTDPGAASPGTPGDPAVGDANGADLPGDHPATTS